MSKRKPELPQLGLSPLVWGAVLFGLSCGDNSNEPPTTGTLGVTVTTPGPVPDADGYNFSIGGIGVYKVRANGTLEIPGLPPGSHTVQLIGLAPHCVVEDGDRRILEVPAGIVTPVAFNVSCVTQLIISISTQGPGGDADGYTVRIDDTDWPASLSGYNATLTVPGLALGVHTVLLGGLASNCQTESWSGPPQNPQYVSIDVDHPTVGVGWMVYCTHSTPY